MPNLMSTEPMINLMPSSRTTRDHHGQHVQNGKCVEATARICLQTTIFHIKPCHLQSNPSRRLKSDNTAIFNTAIFNTAIFNSRKRDSGGTQDWCPCKPR